MTEAKKTDRIKPPPATIEKRAEAEARTIYTEEAERDLIETSLRLAKTKFADWKQTHSRNLWLQGRVTFLKEHEERAKKIRSLFEKKQSGHRS